MWSDGRALDARSGTPAEPATILAPDLLAQQPPDGDPYDFLVGSVIDAGTLRLAKAESERCGIATHDALLAMGLVSPTAYVTALARSLGVPLAGWDAAFGLKAAEDVLDPVSMGVPATIAGCAYRVLCAECTAPDALRRHASALQRRGERVALATRARLEAALHVYWQAQRIDEAAHGLLRRRPEQSAGAGLLRAWQRITALTVAGALLAGFAVLPEAVVVALTGVTALPLLCVALVRVLALREMARGAGTSAYQDAPADLDGAEAQMPAYSALVPLFREARVVAGLVRSLDALDYPRSKLEVLLILEASDIETQAAVLGLGLPPGFRTVIVPDGAPRTKPKALNFALQFARGEYIVVYDAEDRPEPDQLRRALDMFRHRPPPLGCVQAQLNVYNPVDSWLTRQFTLEYCGLFDAILPALARLGLPIPLGGTSNHFRRATLVAAGAWDPFNVTEDADLGFRLARQGWRTAVLASTTWEEAPASFVGWFRQRTRWLKGWIQTYLVHTREPWRLGAELGLRGVMGFHVLMGGPVLLALVHPLFYAILAYHAASGQLLAPPPTAAGAALWAVAGVNLAFGYGTAIVLGAASAWRRGHARLIRSALLMPLCWLLVSAAAYRALYQLATDPYLWEKTEHGRGEIVRS
jgi:hypothetical protein